MKKHFNTTGPVFPAKHYCIDPMQRLDWKEIHHLIDAEKYFVLHAPRQTGKTSTLLKMMEVLNAGDQYKALYVNIYEMTWKDKAARDRSTPIIAERYKAARERLIRARETHLDQLTDKLKEPRVNRVIAAILSG